MPQVDRDPLLVSERSEDRVHERRRFRLEPRHHAAESPHRFIERHGLGRQRAARNPGIFTPARIGS